MYSDYIMHCIAYHGKDECYSTKGYSLKQLYACSMFSEKAGRSRKGLHRTREEEEIYRTSS